MRASSQAVGLTSEARFPIMFNADIELNDWIEDSRRDLELSRSAFIRLSLKDLMRSRAEETETTKEASPPEGFDVDSEGRRRNV